VRRPQAIEGLIVLALALAVAHNVVTFARAQASETCRTAPCRRPRDLEQLAREDVHPVVRGQLAVFEFLRQRIAGARLTIPPSFAGHRWSLEHISRVEVVVAPSAPRIALDRRFALRQGAVRREWLVASPHTFRPVNLALGARTADHVLAELEPGGELFVLPADVYRANAAAPP
jgi:hypothetical protein